MFANTKCLSADVNAAYDPTFADVFEENNVARLNKGVVVTKYTGARGKSGTSDASAETMAFFAGILNEHGVIWQTGELGKIDIGGGGTCRCSRCTRPMRSPQKRTSICAISRSAHLPSDGLPFGMQL